MGAKVATASPAPMAFGSRRGRRVPEPSSRPAVDELTALGVLGFEQLKACASQEPDYLVDGLVPAQSIGILVGDSGLGKTPLALALGVSIAAGKPFLGRATSVARVLYCAGEGSSKQIAEMLGDLAESAGLTHPPDNFRIWSPYWGGDPMAPDATGFKAIYKRVLAFKPQYVIVDTLRAIAPSFEEKAANASTLIQSLKKMTAKYGCGWLLIHHLRKQNREHPPASLEESPLQWFQEVAGSNGAITQTDVRLGLTEPNRPNRGDLVLGGFLRGAGALQPMRLVRKCGPDGRPVGYSPVTGLTALTSRETEVLAKLEAEFRFTDVKNALGGGSDSNAKKCLEAFESAGLVKQTEPRGPYRKLALME